MSFLVKISACTGQWNNYFKFFCKGLSFYKKRKSRAPRSSSFRHRLIIECRVDFPVSKYRLHRSYNSFPKLAFDHKEILNYAVRRLRAKVSYSNIVYGLMPKQFRLSELQRMYEIIINDTLDKRNFRKRMLATDLLQETGKKDLHGAHRPAKLYQFKKMEITYFN